MGNVGDATGGHPGRGCRPGPPWCAGDRLFLETLTCTRVPVITLTGTRNIPQGGIGRLVELWGSRKDWEQSTLLLVVILHEGVE